MKFRIFFKIQKIMTTNTKPTIDKDILEFITNQMTSPNTSNTITIVTYENTIVLGKNQLSIGWSNGMFKFSRMDLVFETTKFTKRT